MKTTLKKTLSAVLALCLALSMSAIAFADVINESGATGTTPVQLSTVDENGDPAATRLCVSVPTSLPLTMDDDGVMTAATNCKISNSSYGAVRVCEAKIKARLDWKLTAFGDKATLASEKVNANKLGFSLQIGGGTVHSTTSASETEQKLIEAPETGCYMSGVGDTANNTVAVVYDAIATPVDSPLSDLAIAEVVFIVEWDTAD